MPPAYSKDVRARVIARVEAGSSRREAAKHFAVSHGTVVNWLARLRETGDCAAKPRGGSTSPLEQHADRLLGFVAEQPDLTLDQVMCAMRERGIPGSRTAVWRFFARHRIILEKKPAQSGADARRRGAGAPAPDTRAKHA
jgi:transposase